MTSVQPHRHRTAWRRVATVLIASALVLLCLRTAGWLRGANVQAASTDPPGNAASDDRACEGCHAEIVHRYRQTAMAKGSGPAATALLPGAFTDESSGVSYRVALSKAVPTLSYQRSATDPRGGLSGEQQVQYFVGSGHRGRTYLYQQEGLWFELPINFYTRRGAWDLAPNYEGQRNMPPALPVDPNCLHCHATGVAPSKPRARNAFIGAPFAQGGIGCSACHGDGAAHVAAGGHAPILNPSKLDPIRRDSACIQCHLEGEAVVYRQGRSLATFIAGDNLQDTAAYFVRASRSAGGARATSQYEALLQSACKRASGDRMTCTTCHDPHASPEPAARVAFYRERCLQCHTAPRFDAAAHHPRQPDCAACHMPSRQTSDISHEQVTDHNIQSMPVQEKTSLPRAGEALVGVPGFAAGERELGLAYAQMALRGDRAAAQRALQLLLPLQSAPDEQVALNLGFLLQASGSAGRAREQYDLALKLNPADETALSNLAILDASEGKLTSATTLLRTAFENNPAQATTASNLALLLCRQAQDAAARAVVFHALRFNPDAPQLRAIERGGCKAFEKR